MRNSSLLIAAVAACGAALLGPVTADASVFASFVAKGTSSNITWQNDVVPAVTKLIPAVTKTTPAVYKTIPAVYKIVGGKNVLVTPAQTVLVTPAITVVVTPAHTVVVTPAHDGLSGSLFSTTAATPGAYGLAKTGFVFQNPLLAKLGTLDASFSFKSATPLIDPALSFGAFLEEPELAGTFAFTYTGAAPLKVGKTTYLTGANLLSGTLGGFDITGKKNGTTAGVTGSTATNDTVDFTSDFFSFAHTGDKDFALNIVSATPKLQVVTGDALHSFSGTTGGSFSTERGPVLTASIPEPATWAIMLLGIAGVGASLRQDRRRVLCAAKASHRS